MKKLSALLLALVLAASAACGSDSEADGTGVSGQSAQQLLRNAKAQLTQARTVTIRGGGTDKDGTIKLGMTYAGKTATGKITLNGGRIRLLKSQGHAYLKGSDAFYRQAAGANAAQFKQVVNGRWILIDENSKDFKDLAGFIDRKAFLGGLVKQLKGNVSKGKEGRIAGIECISLEDASGKLWLNASNGNLVRLVTDDGQALNFSYQRVRPVKPPKQEDVFDLACLN